jgi:hypothetical protein
MTTTHRFYTSRTPWQDFIRSLEQASPESSSFENDVTEKLGRISEVPLEKEE